MALSNDPMHKHAVPGRIVKEWVMPARGYAAFEMKAGQVLRHVDLEGKQVPDVVCFNARDHGECLNLGNTMLLNKRRELVTGNVIYSIICRPMMTIVGYSNELSYAYGPMCSEELKSHSLWRAEHAELPGQSRASPRSLGVQLPRHPERLRALHER